MTRLGRLALLLAVAIPAAALAEDKVDVTVQVVAASKKGDAFDPNLASMKGWAKQLSYTSVRQVSSQKVSVSKAPVEVKLPDNKTATLKLLEVKSGSGRLWVRTPPGTEATFSLGREGNSYQGAGSKDGEDLWLVISPPGASEKQPRRACGSAARPHAATAVIP